MAETTAAKKSEFDFTAFVAKHQKNILIGIGGVIVASAAVWIVIASHNLKESRGEVALGGAERSFYSGNNQLAETDLSQVVRRYSGTAAGAQASILLAKTYFNLGKPAQGVAALREALNSGASKPFRSDMLALVGAGYENLGKFDSAATAYSEAASASMLLADKEAFQADQARALADGGKRTEALKIWQGIAAREDSPLAPLAKVRVGELTAAPAKGS